MLRSAAAWWALRGLRTPLLALWLQLLLIVGSPRITTAEETSVSVLPAIFRGSGCRNPDEVKVTSFVNELGGFLHVAFSSPFTASTRRAGRHVRLTCNGVIPIVVEHGKRIGVTQIRVGGHVELESESSTAVVTTEYFFPGDSGPTTQHRFMARDHTHRFGLEAPSAVVWSKCGGKMILRINTALTAGGTDTAIVLVDGDADEEAPDGIRYEVYVRDCIPDPRPEL